MRRTTITIALLTLALASAVATAQTTSDEACQQKHREGGDEARETYLTESKACHGDSACLKDAKKRQAERLKALGAELRACEAQMDRSREPRKAGVSENVTGTEQTDYQEYGTKRPAMTGSTWVGGVQLFIETASGRLVGQAVEGPVSVRSQPARFSRAEGFLVTSDTFRITRLWDLADQPFPLPPSRIDVPMAPRAGPVKPPARRSR